MPDFYGTPAGFRAYHTARDHDVPAEALDDATVSAWLLKASEWIDGTYRGGFSGTKVGMRSQVREWPRNAAYDIYGYMIVQESVPSEVEYATYEAALRHGTNLGSLLVDYTPGKYKAVSIDGAVSATYAGFNSGADAQTQFLAIDQILFPIMTANGASSSLSGSVGRA